MRPSLNTGRLDGGEDSDGPRFLVLAADIRGVGGVQRASRMFVDAITARWGEQRVHVLAVAGDLVDDSTGSPPSSGGICPRGRSHRTSLLARAAYLVRAARTARGWRQEGLIVIACHLHLAPIAWAASLASHAPYGVWCYGIEAWGKLKPWARFSLRRAAMVLAISRFTAQSVEAAAGMRRGTVEVVPLALSPELVIPDTHPKARTVVTVARLDPHDAYKGIDVLVRAWPLVLAEIPDAELVVVGDGPDRSRLLRLADVLDVASRVRFAGWLSDDDLAKVYASARVFALPSRYTPGPKPEGEGFGLVFVEAGAAGLPVVAGRGGASGEVVADGVSGLLVDPRNERDVAHAIGRLLGDPVLAQRLGAEGQLRARQLFSFEAYREALGGAIERMQARYLNRTCAESSAL